MGKSKAPILRDYHRTFLVREFACFATPMEAADALKEKYDIEITPQGAQHYQPDSSSGRTLAQKWVELFGVARKAFLEDVEKHVPEAYKAVRIHELAKASRVLKKNGNYFGMANMLERIAKESGNVHTNRREFTGKDRGPIKHADVSEMTDEHIDAELTRLWDKAHGVDHGEEPKSTKH